MKAYINGKIFTGQAIETNKAVLTDNGIIQAITTEVPSQYQQIDLKGNILAPAFIDMQIYGGNKKLFSHELSIESLQATYEYCLQGGASHFMITMATNTIEKFLKGFEVVKTYWKQGGKGLLGLHLEGPYINAGKRGAHLANCVKKPTVQEVAMLIEKGGQAFKMMTLAPEECDDEVIELLLKNNIILSAGHTNANYQQAMHGFNLGIPAATHLFNAMSPLQHREPGMVGAIFNSNALSSIVCDGVHVDFEVVKIAKKALGNRLYFITDAVTDTTEGEYPHVFKGDRYTLPDGTLSGSALTMLQCVKNGVEKCGFELEEALRMASTYPAQLLPKKDANFIILDGALNLIAAPHQSYA